MKILKRFISCSKVSLRGKQPPLRNLIPFMKATLPKENPDFTGNIEKVKTMIPWIHEKYRKAAEIERKEKLEEKKRLEELKEVKPKISQVVKKMRRLRRRKREELKDGEFHTDSIDSPNPLENYQQKIKEYREKYKVEVEQKEKLKKLSKPSTQPTEYKFPPPSDEHLVNYAVNVLLAHQYACIKAEKVEKQNQIIADNYKAKIEEIQKESVKNFVTIENIEEKLDDFLDNEVKTSFTFKEVLEAKQKPPKGEQEREKKLEERIAATNV